MLGREPNAREQEKRGMAGSMDTLGIEPRASRMLRGVIPLHHIALGKHFWFSKFTKQSECSLERRKVRS